MAPAVFDFVDYISSLKETKKHISITLFSKTNTYKEAIFLNKIKK